MLREWQINLLIERINAGRKSDATNAERQYGDVARTQLLSVVAQYRAFAAKNTGRVADAVNLRADEMLADAGIQEYTMENDFVTVTDAAAITGRPAAVIRKLAASGALPSTKVGRALMVKRSALAGVPPPMLRGRPRHSGERCSKCGRPVKAGKCKRCDWSASAHPAHKRAFSL